jgi:ribosomal protein L12E/L44/L45/RPP1/RPP2
LRNESAGETDIAYLAQQCSHLKGDKINAILKAAAYEVEPYWPGLFANALESVKVSDLISNVGAGVGSAPAAAAAPAAAPAAAGKKGNPIFISS